jgi:hypothetical protein
MTLVDGIVTGRDATALTVRGRPAQFPSVELDFTSSFAFTEGVVLIRVITFRTVR